MSDIKHPKALQAAVLERFMTDKQFDNLFKDYLKHRKATGGGARNRKSSFEQPIDAELFNALKTYIQDTDTPTKEIAESLKISKSAVRSKLATTAFRLIYSKPSFFK